MMMAKCGPLLIFLEYLFCLGAGAPVEDNSAMMQMTSIVSGHPTIHIVAFSDVHGTQEQNQQLDKDIPGKLPPGYQANSDLNNFLRSDSWRRIQEWANRASTWGVVYGGDGTTAYNPFLPAYQQIGHATCKYDHCQDSVVEDIKLLVSHISKLGPNNPLLKKILLAGNHDACLDPERIVKRNCEDWKAAKQRAEDLIDHITNEYPKVQLKNKMKDKIELFTTKQGGDTRYLCLSSSSPARPGPSKWPVDKTQNPPIPPMEWSNELNGAFQYVQSGTTDRICPQWTEKDDTCAVIQYHGAPGSPFAKFNDAFKWHSTTENCQQELANTVKSLSERTAKWTELPMAPAPVVLAGHTHVGDFAAMHGGAPLTMPIDTTKDMGISNYNTAEISKDIPDVKFGNTAVKWQGPAFKERTLDLVGGVSEKTRGWLPPIIVSCDVLGKETCKIARESPEEAAIEVATHI